MMNEKDIALGKHIPSIRFEGFSGEWKEKELTDEVVFFTGLTYSPNDVIKDAGTFVLRSSNVKGGEIVAADNVYVTSKVVNSENVKVGDIIVVVRNGSRSLIGKHAQVKQEMDKTVIGAFMTGIHTEQSSFINALLDTNKFTKEIEKNLGATINQITTGAFKKMQFWFSPPQEQTKIGNYFQQLDTLITQHQQKHDKLLNIKKSLLEKMFPKQGEAVPEIRFKGFSGEWEENELYEVTESYSGGTPQVGNRDFYQGEIPFIRSAEINSNTTELFISDLGLRKSSAKLVSVGCILYALYGATSGEVGRSKIDGAINQAILAIIPDKMFSQEFIMQWLRKNKSKIISTYLQGGQGNLSGAIVKSLVLNHPQYEEQTKIGNLFKHLDTLLSQHQTQLKKLKNIKQACLEKMFV